MSQNPHRPRLFRYLRFRRFDTTTAEGRADERYRLATYPLLVISTLQIKCRRVFAIKNPPQKMHR